MSADGVKLAYIKKASTKNSKPLKISPKSSPKGSPKTSPDSSPKTSPKSSIGAPPPPPWLQQEPINPHDWKDEEDEMPPLSEPEPTYQAHKITPYVINDASLINGMALEEAQKVANTGKIPLAQCDTCGKYYAKQGTNSMMTYEYMEGQPVCFHCMFWMNYDVTTRGNVDGVFGKTIVGYILQCKDYHDKITCTRHTNNGGCFLCDYLNGAPVEGVIESDMLLAMMLSENKTEDAPVKEADSVDLQSEEFSFSISI